MKKFVPILMALICAAFLIPPVIALINGEPFRAVSIVLAMVFLTLAIVTSQVLRKKSGGAPGPPSA